MAEIPGDGHFPHLKRSVSVSDLIKILGGFFALLIFVWQAGSLKTEISDKMAWMSTRIDGLECSLFYTGAITVTTVPDCHVTVVRSQPPPVNNGRGPH